MSQDKLILNLQLEIIFLAVVLIFYLLLRYAVIRRPIAYKEFESWLLRFAAVCMVGLIAYFMVFY